MRAMANDAPFRRTLDSEAETISWSADVWSNGRGRPQGPFRTTSRRHMAYAAGPLLDVGNCVTSGSAADLLQGLDFASTLSQSCYPRMLGGQRLVGQDHSFRRILSIAFPFAGSSTSLSR